MNISIKRTSKIYLVVEKEFWLFLVGKNEKLGIRLEKNICRKKESKIYLKQTGDHVIIKRNGYKIRMHFAIVLKVMIVTMMMRIIMKIINSSSYLRVLLMVATKYFHQFFNKNYLTILPSARTAVEHFYLLKL